MSETAAWSDLLEVPLTDEERRRISLRLGADLIGVGLLVVGWVLGSLAPDQAQVAALIQAVAALVVATPVVLRAGRSVLHPTPVGLTDQIVALAVLSSMATGAFATATLVPVLLEVGRLFEERSARGAQAAIEGIRRMRARVAHRLREDGTEEEIAADALQPGDVVLVRPGELLPADGRVRAGRSSIDQAPVTGESAYETAIVGSEVFAGTLNLDGLLEIEVQKAGDHTVLGRVVELLQEVEASRIPVVRLLERYGAHYLPLVVAVAATVLFWTEDVERAITVLVVSCPTALVLAGPAAMVAGMTAATRRSILIKSAAFLERVASVDTLVLDKTGTVTLGRQEVRAIHTSLPEEEALTLAAAVAHGSLHPVSRAVTRAAEQRGLQAPRAVDSREVPGHGVEAELEGRKLRLGRLDWLREAGVQGELDSMGSGTWLAVDDTLVARFDLHDTPRPEGPEVVADMRSLGMDRVVLLTGDRKEVAEDVGQHLGVDEVVADVLPQEKLAIVRREQEAGRTVLMVGDGVNDALALSGADVGVAIGVRMNEVALGGAHVALTTDDLRRLPEMVRLAEATLWTTTTNAIVGIGFSAVMVGLASWGAIPPLWGAMLHNLGALLVVGNSVRLLRPEPVSAD